MKWARTLTVCVAPLAAVMAWAQVFKPLLGIPFGAPLKLTQCPFNTDQAREPCWIGAPTFYKSNGSTSGSVHLPDADRRPEWAAYALFDLTLDRAGKVQELRVHTFRQSRKQIADSVSLRFGSPITNELTRIGAGWARWKSSEGTVEMNCSGECWTTFRTPAAQAERDAELAERARKEAARPTAP